MSFFSRSKTTLNSTNNDASDEKLDQQPTEKIVKKNTMELGRKDDDPQQDLVGLKFD